jgi:hypothetical protein
MEEEDWNCCGMEGREVAFEDREMEASCGEEIPRHLGWPRRRPIVKSRGWNHKLYY